MPELPEAETIARGLQDFLPGRRIRSVRVPRPDLLDDEVRTFRSALSGARWGEVGRRGKNVILGLADGRRLAVNLGMTGRLLPSISGEPPYGSRHPGVVFIHHDGSTLTFDDVRRFGRLTLVDREAWARWSRRLGPEPLSPSFTARRLADILGTSRSPVRSLLLDQRKVAGVGNIYAVEALWAAGIHPETPSREIEAPSAVRLHRALRRILRRAITARGTTLRDYRTAGGEEGGFGPALMAYGREGEACKRCKTPLERTMLSGRSAFFCPRCQPPVTPGGESTGSARAALS